ncbi:MAG: hypothetical protein AAFQ61_11665 [Cyanobacteria bacterium J06626_23]
MPLKKISSRAYKEARVRISRIKAIEPQLDFGPSLTVVNYQKQIDQLSNKITEYNSLLSVLDRMRGEIKIAETTLSDTSTQMLKAVAVQFGLDSLEYKQAGGVRKSERKRPVRKVEVTVTGV